MFFAWSSYSFYQERMFHMVAMDPEQEKTSYLKLVAQFQNNIIDIIHLNEFLIGHLVFVIF